MEHNDKALFLFCITCIVLLIGGIVISVSNANKSKDKTSIKTITIQSQQKDTSSYHWSDEYTDNQLREMVRSGHLKLR